MPIGIVAGSAAYMDALDGGSWRFGDDSFPEASTTWFAGTFVRHPLAMAAARAALTRLKESGPDLQRRVNERADRLRAMVAGAINDMIDTNGRLYAVRYVADLPGGGGALEKAEVEAIIKAVAAERGANEFLAATVELLVPDAGGEAAEMLIDALADKIGPTSRALLIRVCRGLPADHVARLATDSRWKVRRAAVGALADSEVEGAAAVLRQSLADEEMSVRAAAAEALARRKDPAALPTLAELASSTMPVVRGTAAYSYGLLGGREGRKGIQPLLYQDRNPEVRVRAIRGLEEAGDPRAPRIILGVFKGESDPRVRAAAANALVKMETPALTDHLIETLQLTDALAPDRVAIRRFLRTGPD